MSVVSVESLGVPARAAVIARLHSALGLNVVVDNDRCPSDFMLLLHRLKALARMPSASTVLLSGSWMLRVPVHPVLRALHADMAAALVEALGIRHAAHLFVCLDAEADEALEAALNEPRAEASSAGSVPSLGALHDARRRLAGETHLAQLTPLAPKAVRFECPRYAADNPAVLDNLLDRVEAAVREALAGDAA